MMFIMMVTMSITVSLNKGLQVHRVETKSTAKG